MEEITVYREETDRIRSLHETLMIRTAQVEHIIDMEPSIQITMPSGICDFKVALACLHKEALEDQAGATFGQRLLQLLSQTQLFSNA